MTPKNCGEVVRGSIGRLSESHGWKGPLVATHCRAHHLSRRTLRRFPSEFLARFRRKWKQFSGVDSKVTCAGGTGAPPSSSLRIAFGKQLCRLHDNACQRQIAILACGKGKPNIAVQNLNAPKKAIQQESPQQVPYWLKALVGTPLLLIGGVVSTLYGMFLGSYLLSRIGGGRPTPELTSLLMLWVMFGGLPLCASIALLGKSTSRKYLWRVMLVILLLSILVAVDGSFGPTRWNKIFARESLPGTDASKLQKTIVSPHLEAPIAPGTNVLWCGTFQLAWNEACRLIGGDIQFDRTDPGSIVLNKHAFTKDSLDETSYVAEAGFVKDDIGSRIREAVDKKFQGTFKPRFLPDPALTQRPNDIVAYACLYKNLSFLNAFERLDETLTFAGVRVPAFGFGTFKPSLEKAFSQVLIFDYQGEDDFLIELKTRSEGDRLILAKIAPKQNLAQTVSFIQSRIAIEKPETAATNDVLSIPRFNFDLTREFSEIEGLLLVSTNANIHKDLYLRSAVQNTKFEMNEKGVELRSEAHLAFGCAQERPPLVKHKMIFNKPFLVMMQRTTAATPYFALWVDNPEILVGWK